MVKFFEWVFLMVLISLGSFCLQASPREIGPQWGPMRLDGVQLRMEDQDVERVLAKEIRRASHCPPTGHHVHRYATGTEVEFDSFFAAERVVGKKLELYLTDSMDWAPLLEVGEPCTAPMPKLLPFEPGSPGCSLVLEQTCQDSTEFVRYHGRDRKSGFVNISKDFEVQFLLDAQGNLANIGLLWLGH